jgi:predicted nucleic acid-binding protein
MGNEILVDSNVLIDVIRRCGDPSPPLLGWAGERNLATCGMVRVEVLRGIISPKVHHKTTIFLDAMINVPSNARLWNTAADLAWQLDRQGIVIPGTDVVIAACAMRIGAAVLTSDPHFSRIDGLETIAPPAEWSVE